MKGVVLAGGQGTRLHPLTKVSNKHLLPVYDRPMIDYPIQTLKDMGCDDIIIVSGGEHIGGIAEYLGGGYTYRVQDSASGIAGALACAEGLVDGIFPVILGDNYFSEAPDYHGKPTLYLKDAPDPSRFGVYHEGVIVEKPSDPPSRDVVTGLYVFDLGVFDFIRTLKPSARNELEITDVNNWYLRNDCLVVNYHGVWLDMGTFDSLLIATTYIGSSKLNESELE